MVTVEVMAVRLAAATTMMAVIAVIAAITVTVVVIAVVLMMAIVVMTAVVVKVKGNSSDGRQQWRSLLQLPFGMACNVTSPNAFQASAKGTALFFFFLGVKLAAAY